ncbi:MAG: ammonium transporter, partial [Chloroflexota bacterium]|nr:ammonium transporter [Chloroflexota bacterium]
PGQPTTTEVTRSFMIATQRCVPPPRSQPDPQRRCDLGLLPNNPATTLPMGAGGRHIHPPRPHAAALALLCTLLFCFVWPTSVFAQNPEPVVPPVPDAALVVPMFWYVLAAALALLVPAGFILIGAAGLEPQHAWAAALGGLGALGLAAFGYWATGFALQFGGVGLVYTLPELKYLVWEWSPLATDWGAGWGVAGLSGWFLSGPNVTALAYALFLAHLPAVVTAAVLPTMALRGRAPTTAPLLLALLMGAVLYPLTGNWVQGGGWLSALGRNLSLGHGFVDFGGAGTVHLAAAGFVLAALVVWAPRRPRYPLTQVELPPVYLPLLTIVGSLLVLAGSLGWMWANPLQVSRLSDLALLRGSVNLILCMGGGLLVPLGYTWFVTSRSDALMSTRGLVAGLVAGLAAGPFVQPGVAFAIGFLAGATVPFVTFLLDNVLRLDDATGVVVTGGAPAMVGLLLIGLFADGVAGSGWQVTGMDTYLGVAGQGVSGLFVAAGYQVDFPGQLQAQIVGILTLGLWGFLTGILFCTPLGLLFHGLQRSENLPQTTVQPVPEPDGFEFEPLEESWMPPFRTPETQERQPQRRSD